jgi:hypothetical protein
MQGYFICRTTRVEKNVCFSAFCLKEEGWKKICLSSSSRQKQEAQRMLVFL